MAWVKKNSGCKLNSYRSSGVFYVNVAGKFTNGSGNSGLR